MIRRWFRAVVRAEVRAVMAERRAALAEAPGPDEIALARAAARQVAAAVSEGAALIPLDDNVVFHPGFGGPVRTVAGAFSGRLKRPASPAPSDHQPTPPTAA